MSITGTAYTVPACDRGAGLVLPPRGAWLTLGSRTNVVFPTVSGEALVDLPLSGISEH